MSEIQGQYAEYLASIMFWCFSSRRYFTSRIADMSSPSLNCPTLIFFMATFLPVEASLPSRQLNSEKLAKSETHLDTPQHTYLHQLFGLWPFKTRWETANGWKAHSYHCFCRSAFAFSTASMLIESTAEVWSQRNTGGLSRA